MRRHIYRRQLTSYPLECDETSQIVLPFPDCHYSFDPIAARSEIVDLVSNVVVSFVLVEFIDNLILLN